MKDCVEEIKSSLLGKKPVSAIATVTKATGLYKRHKVDLLRGKWILKVSKIKLCSCKISVCLLEKCVKKCLLLI